MVTPGLHQGHQQVQHLGGQPAGPAHALEIGRAVHGHGEMRLARGLEICRLSGMMVIGLAIYVEKLGYFLGPV